MRKLIVAEHISLDGVIQSPGGPEEDPSGEFRLGGWVVPYADEASGQDLQDLLSQPFELLLGRRTYDIWAAYWPHVPVDSGSHAIADLFNSVPKHVATHRSDTLDWQNSHALEGDLADAIRALKQQDGANLLTWGSADMVRQLLAAGLVDELRLMIYPVVLGRGKRLFGENAQPSAFTLAHSTGTPGGVLLTRYVRSGEVRTGAFEEVEQETPVTPKQWSSDMTTPAKNTVCLWYDGSAEDAARFYADTFPDSSVGAVHRAPGDFPSGKKGDVLTVEFTVMGIPCLGLNGGPAFTHNEAFSFQVATTDQEETDRYWNAIVGNGGQESACGWCKDKWGVSWQITPIALTKAITDPDPAAAKRAFDAMMQMIKIDIAAIEMARRG